MRANGDSPTLRICALYPSRMNIYADRGNMILLQRRCEARGLGFELTAAEQGEDIDPAAHDLFYIGGGQDRDQVQIAGDMVRTKRDALARAADDGRVILAVCGGYQLLGEYYELDGKQIEGLGIVDLRTVREPGPRLIGNVMIDVDIGGDVKRLAGFENHGGRTYLGGGAKPLGKVVEGYGNNGKDGCEGVRRDNVIGTYLHGPLLPKNAWFADYLTELALGREHSLTLEPLPDELEDLAHESAIRAAQRSHGFAARLRGRR
jgi:CobQ-like glutamine amidotransferase family enzyme